MGGGFRSGIAGRALALAALAAGLAWFAAAPATASRAMVHRIVIDGPISPATDDYIETAIDDATEAGAAALVVQMDTPGGLLNSTKTIVKNMLASPIPVFVYVGPGGASATSAGVFITMAGHVAAMAPGTSIGAAHPVAGGAR